MVSLSQLANLAVENNQCAALEICHSHDDDGPQHITPPWKKSRIHIRVRSIQKRGKLGNDEGKSLHLFLNKANNIA